MPSHHHGEDVSRVPMSEFLLNILLSRVGRSEKPAAAKESLSPAPRRPHSLFDMSAMENIKDEETRPLAPKRRVAEAYSTNDRQR